MHVNEGKGKLALFWNERQCFDYPIPLLLLRLIYFLFLILLFIFNFHPRPGSMWGRCTVDVHGPRTYPTLTFCPHHISIVFYCFAPPPPRFLLFPSSTTTATTFLLFSLHHHHRHHLSIVFFPQLLNSVISVSNN